MQYGEVRQAHFLERPNRFIAHVELEGETVVCHVKNTGRCRELLVRGATVYLERGTNPARRTAWDLIAVEKGHRLINMDAQAPNRILPSGSTSRSRRSPSTRSAVTGTPGWTSVWSGRRGCTWWR